jgi:hypothetical protein
MALLLSTTVPMSAQVPVSSNEPVIVTTGESTLVEAPDRAYVQIAAEGRASKPSDAQRVAAEAMVSVQTALKSLGIPADQIRTTGYNLVREVDYSGGAQVFRDYLARNQIEVRVDDLTRLSAVVDASGASGAASISGLRFDVKARDAFEQEALKRAVEDATSRARAVALGAGRTLGGIVRIEEHRGQTAQPMAFVAGGGRGGGVSTPIAPGEIEIRASVTLTTSIK